MNRAAQMPTDTTADAGTTLKQIEAHTDGACLGNPGPGGWAALLRYRGRERELAGGEADTTNNRMELMARDHGAGSAERTLQHRPAHRLAVRAAGHHRVDRQLGAPRLEDRGRRPR